MFKQHLTEIQQHDYTETTETTETILPASSSSSSSSSLIMNNEKNHQKKIKWKIFENNIIIKNFNLLRLNILFENKCLPSQFYIFRVLDYHELFGWSAGKSFFLFLTFFVFFELDHSKYFI